MIFYLQEFVLKKLQPRTIPSFREQKFDLSTRKLKNFINHTFHGQSFLTWFYKLISDILWRIVDFRFPFALNDFLNNNDFVMLITRHFSMTSNNIKQFINLWYFWKSINEYEEAIIRMCSVKKVFSENFAKFTGKCMCQISIIIEQLKVFFWESPNGFTNILLS